MTVRFWVALAALPVAFVGCSSEGDTPPAPGSGAQGATAGTSSSGGSAGSAGGSAGGGQGGSITAGSAGTSAGSGGTSAGSGGASGSGGSAGSGGATGGPVTPTEVNGKYTFAYGDVVFEVDATVAGRVVTFSKGGTNVLDDGDGMDYYGSTLWLAPEEVYGFPPEGIDAGAFTPTLEGATLVLTGPLDAPSGFSASKRFTVDSALDRVEVVYSLKNETATTPVAAWEVTRLAHSGISFFSAPTVGMVADWGTLTHVYDDVTHVTWIDQVVDEPLGGKLFQDGAGWLAHAQGTLLFMKTFPDLQPAEFADPDTEVEVYVSPPETDYIELENSGPLTTLAAGESLTYTTQWYLRTIPGTVTVAASSQTLLDFAAGIAQ
ncbi:MAG TPA: hypothetical protein VM686_13620 [Polyangiaceae bacterium]|nr:hypothetical protein [Polyangiaceae bacterium]